MKTLFERMSDIARGERRALGRRPVSGLAEVDQVRRPSAAELPDEVPTPSSTEGRRR
jgi:hypothetical protein